MKETIKTFLYLLAACGAAFFMICFVGQRTVVEGSSMEPTLADGDNLIVDKLSYRFGKPERFDIIVFPYEEGEETYFIKRVIGLPGETVQIDEAGTIFINGEKLRESYGKEVIENSGMAAEGILLGADEYFVLGDNRNDSMDSRDGRVGTIKEADIVGRAWMRIYPWGEMGIVAPDQTKDE